MNLSLIEIQCNQNKWSKCSLIIFMWNSRKLGDPATEDVHADKALFIDICCQILMALTRLFSNDTLETLGSHDGDANENAT